MYISLSVRANQLERRELNYQLSSINKVFDDRPSVDNASAYSPTVFFVQQHERGVQRKTEVSVLLTPSKRGKGSAGEGEKGKKGHVIYARCFFLSFFPRFLCRFLFFVRFLYKFVCVCHSSCTLWSWVQGACLAYITSWVHASSADLPLYASDRRGE